MSGEIIDGMFIVVLKVFINSNRVFSLTWCSFYYNFLHGVSKSDRAFVGIKQTDATAGALSKHSKKLNVILFFLICFDLLEGFPCSGIYVSCMSLTLEKISNSFIICILVAGLRN